MKRFWLIPAALCLLLAGCEDLSAQPAEETSQPTEIIVSDVNDLTTEPMLFPIEICGTEVSDEAKRVVSLSPAVTEIIAELGYSDRLCGISSYCDYPELSLQTVGSAENPDIAVITALAPDVLFTLSDLSERDIYAIEECGAAVVVLESPTTPEGYGKLYSDISSAFIGDVASHKLAEDAVTELNAAADRVVLTSYVYVTGKKTAAGLGTFENAVLSLCCENVCTEEGYAELAALTDVMPDYIIASDELSYNDIAYDDVLSAFVNNGAEVVFVSSSAFERPSARTCDVFTQIARQLADDTGEAAPETAE